MTDLEEVLSAEAILALSGERVYRRGVAYRSEGRAEHRLTTGQRIESTVRGTIPYEVVLWVDEGEPGWSCTCPYAEDGLFCKHCVAVALTVVAEASPSLPIAVDWAAPSGDSDLTSNGSRRAPR